MYVTVDAILMAVPFDETTLALTGDAVALVEGVRVGFAGNMDLAVSETGTLFYTTRGAEGGGLAELVWVTRDGTAEEIHPGWTLSDATLLDAILGDERRTPTADEVERLLRDKRTRYMEAIRSRRCIMPGAGRLIDDLHRRWPLAICSGALRTEVTCILNHEGLTNRFGAIVTSDDFTASKPDPEGFLLTLDRLRQAMPSLAAASCIVLEDSRAGLAAARSAGMRTLGVGHGRAAERLADAETVAGSVSEITADRLTQWFG